MYLSNLLNFRQGPQGLLFLAVLALEAFAAGFLVHDLYVLVHVVLEVEALSTVLAEVPVLPVDVLVTAQTALGQEGLATNVTVEYLQSSRHII